MSLKLKCHKKFIVTKTEMLPNIEMSKKNVNQKQNPGDWP